jgi:hypothetical protein
MHPCTVPRLMGDCRTPLMMKGNQKSDDACRFPSRHCCSTSARWSRGVADTRAGSELVSRFRPWPTCFLGYSPTCILAPSSASLVTVARHFPSGRGPVPDPMLHPSGTASPQSNMENESPGRLLCCSVDELCRCAFQRLASS